MCNNGAYIRVIVKGSCGVFESEVYLGDAAVLGLNGAQAIELFLELRRINAG